jgi:hypothetical protein
VVANKRRCRRWLWTAGRICSFVMLFNLLHIETRWCCCARRIECPARGRVGVIHWKVDANTPRGPRLEMDSQERCRAWGEEAGLQWARYRPSARAAVRSGACRAGPGRTGPRSHGAHPGPVPPCKNPANGRSTYEHPTGNRPAEGPFATSGAYACTHDSVALTWALE